MKAEKHGCAVHHTLIENCIRTDLLLLASANLCNRMETALFGDMF
jgi:hypothetical protein